MTFARHLTFADLAPLANHLWQSTLCIGVVWLATLALRKNRPAVRYWLWFAASVKFLIPFSLLASIGSRLAWRAAPAIVQPQWSLVMDNVSSPFAASVPALHAAVPYTSLPIPAVLVGVWLCGVAAGVAFWVRCSRKMRAVRRSAAPLALDLPILVMSSLSRIEPGVFGIFRPVLFLPEGIADRLTQSQLHAILAHEMCHVRRRDNLTAAIHMFVETVFWFHPLVWWIRMQLIEERERACDEEVVRLGADPETYAEGIVAVCKSYIESPAACVSGISGSDLKKRIVCIMSRRLGDNLTFRRKLLLAVIGIVAFAGPVAFGSLNAPVLHVQSTQTPTGRLSTFEVTSIRPNHSGENRRILSLQDPGRFTATNVTTKMLIEYAYGVKDFQLSGGPDWINSKRYDIDAKIEDSVVSEERDLTFFQRQDRIRPMVQSLLADRFGLKVTHETKELPVYALVVSKNGPKLSPTSLAPSGSPTLPPGIDKGSARASPGMAVFGLRGPVSAFADALSVIPDLGGRIVLDRTGLTGDYDFTLRFTPEGPALNNAQGVGGGPPDSLGPSLFTALQEQLGLRLESTRGAVDTILIDHVETPSDN